MSDQRFATAEAAEAEFYRAFETADQNAMMAVWADDDNIACVHPGGPLLLGRRAVMDGWRQVLAEPGRMSFRVEPQSQSSSGELAVHILHEHITLTGELHARTPVVVTNIYRQTPSGWRMVLHQASPNLRGGGAEREPAARATVH